MRRRFLLTTSRTLAEAVAAEVERQLATLPTAAVARPSIDNNGAIVVVDSLDQAVEFSNALAPEHLACTTRSLLANDPKRGRVFLGPASPEAAGDYASGPNHVLPTSGAARLRGGLSAADFVKVISVQELTPRGAREADAGHHHSGPRRGSGSARALRGGSPRWLSDLHTARSRPCEMAPYSPPTGGREGQAAARFQREHRRVLAAGDRISAGTSHREPALDLSRIRRRACASSPRFSASRADEFTAHQRHRRSHSGSDQYLSSTTATTCCC